MSPKYPKIFVQLVGDDGNAFYIISKVRRALLKNSVSDSEAQAFVSEAFKQQSYKDLLNFCASWVKVF